VVALLISCTVQNVSAVIRDGGIDPANLGKGDWVYYTSAVTSGMGGNVPSVNSLASFMAYEKSQGIRYIVYKAASGSTLYPNNSSPQFTTSVVNAAHTAGLLIFGYNRSGQGGVDVAGEVAVADFVFSKGADGYVWDAESEWEAASVPNNTNLAWQICGQVRTNWPNKFLAHAPFPIISYHSTFPYKEFGYWSDTVMPQIYHAGWANVKASPSGGINWSDSNWVVWQNSLTGMWTNSIKPLAPINHVYGPNPPNSGVSHIPDSDVGQFIDYLNADTHSVTAGGYKGVSFWRADLHGAAQWAYIKEATIGDFPGIVNNIVIDNPSANRVGSWNSVKIFNNGTFYGTTEVNTFGTNYYSKAQGTGAAYVEFTPNVVTSGDYNVYEWHPTLPSASANTPFVINYNGGSTTVNANQQINSGQWNLLGRFNFASGSAGNIRVMDNFTDAGQVAVADGVKLIFIPPTFPPTAPSGLTAVAASSSQINLTWKDNATNESSFVLARGTNSGGPYTDVATLAADVTNYNNAGLTPTTTYYYVVRAVNVNGASTNSNQASATTLGLPPVITSQPRSLSVVTNQNATFNVTVTGTVPLSYQWRFNAANIVGATTSTYTRVSAQLINAGSYSVVVTNIAGSITSSNAILTVTTNVIAPSITTQPTNQTVIAGQTASFTVAANGTTPLSYQWYQNGTLLGGATAPAYTKTNAQIVDAGSYFVVVANSARSVTSAVVTLTIKYTLTVTPTAGGTVTNSPNQPSYTTNSAVTLTATADPGSSFIGWSGDAGGTNNPLDVTMTTNLNVNANFLGTPTELIIDNPQATVVGSWSAGTSSADKYGDDYRYKSKGSGSSSLTYTPNIYFTGQYQVFEWHPKGNNRTTGAPFVINYATGTDTKYVNEQVKGGAWNLLGVYPFTNGSSGNVMITDGIAESDKVILADAIRFVLVIPPAAPSALTATAVNSSQINLNWQDNSTNEDNFMVARGTNSGGPYMDIAALPLNTTNYSDLGLVEATTYYYVVRARASGVDSTNSNEQLATTLPGPPTITTQPQPQVITEGQNVSFTVSATSRTPITYQWRFNDSNIPRATNSTYNLTNVLMANAGEYTVEVGNDVASVISDIALLTVHLALHTSVIPANSGTILISPDQPGYVVGDIVTLTAVANPTFTFFGWSGDVLDTNSSIQITMTSTKNLVANFISTADLIIDNPDASYIGNWTIGTAAIDKYGDYYQYASTVNDFISTADAIYAPNIITAGKYDVLIWYPQGTNRTSNAQILISFNGDSILTNADQTIGGGSWHLLAVEKDFAAGTDGYVDIGNNTGEANKVVNADAVRFIYSTGPIIASQPLSQTAMAGTSAAFTVLAAGTGQTTYQWQFNGTAITGATDSTYTRANLKMSDAGNYTVSISNRIATVTSTTAVLVVLPPPQIISFGTSNGGQFNFSLSATTNLSYLIEGSTNLNTWITRTNIFNSNGILNYTDSTTNLKARFYRARWTP